MHVRKPCYEGAEVYRVNDVTVSYSPLKSLHDRPFSVDYSPDKFNGGVRSASKTSFLLSCVSLTFTICCPEDTQ